MKFQSQKNLNLNFKSMILKYYKKIKSKVRNIYQRLFSYPTFKFEINKKNSYWQTRNSNSKKIHPNDFQTQRAKIFSNNIDEENALLFDIGSGNGAQLIAIKDICSNLEIIGSDKDKFACKLMKTNNLECHHILDEKDIFTLIKKYKPKYITIFEVLEHMYSPEHFLLSLLKNKEIKIIFASVPNSGFLMHRLRYLIGRFPIQWIASPNEHIRFWTIKDLQWWLKYLNIKKNTEIVPYKGYPILNKVFPNIFAQGSFMIIKNNF